MGNFFSRLFGESDKSNDYRWSLIILKNGNINYELLSDSVNSILGLISGVFGDKGNPKSPWELRLRFNRTGKEIKLTKDYFFSDSSEIHYFLTKELDKIDSNYNSYSSRREVFVDRISGEKCVIPTLEEIEKESMAGWERLKTGKFNPEKYKFDFFNTLNSLFG